LSDSVDSPEAKSLELEGHLDGCPACRAEREAWQALGERLRVLPAEKAPQEMRLLVSSACAVSRPPRRGIPVRTVLAAAAVLMMIAGVASLAVLRSTGPEAASFAYVEDHVSVLQENGDKGFPASAASELEDWLTSQLGFAAAVPSWPWADFRAARLCTLRGERIALVELRIADNAGTLYIHPTMEPAVSQGATLDSPVIFTHKGFAAAAWETDGLEYVLVTAASRSSTFDHLDLQISH